VFPVSFAQQRLWLIDKLEPRVPLYNLARAFRLTGDLDVEALRRALDELIGRHEILRTHFDTERGNPLQVIRSESVTALDVEGLEALPEDGREDEARRRLWNEWAVPFDLEQGPLIRCRLLRLGPNNHWLMLTWHHIISDAWSGGILRSDVSALYNAFHRGRPSPLAALPAQYGDYVLWQRELLQGEMLAEHLAYWTSALAGLAVLDLPTDRPRPLARRHAGGRVALRLGSPLTSALKAFSRREGVTLFMTILAAYQVVLARHTGQDDIAVGAPVAGRLRPELEGLIGLFVNTLVLRTDTSGNPAFVDLVHRVRDVCLGAYSHQELPFEKLVEALRPKRVPGRNPLFDVMLNFSPRSAHPLQFDGVSVANIEFDAPLAKFDLLLSLTETDGELRGGFEYAADLFDESTVERMAGHFTTLLEGIIAAPETPIGMLPLLTSGEREQLLVEWNATAVEHPRDQCVHQRVEQQAARTPNAVAVEYEGAALTYAELNARANRLAHHLRTFGVGADVLVGVCVERSLELVVALLAILKAGGAYVPLDPGYPAERLAFMLGDTQAPVVLTQAMLRDRLPAGTARVLCLDRDAPTWSDASVDNPAPAAGPQHLAYVIYTSGSTGRPKGVMMPHGPICNLLAWQTRTSSVINAPRTLQLAPVGFDVSVQEIFSTLWMGGTLVLIPDEMRRDPEALLETLDKSSVARLFLTFTALQQIAESADVRRCAPRQLREVIAAGEQLRITPAIARWLDALPGCRLYNQYGPTETHVVTAHSALEAPSRSWPILPPIGRPIANARLYVLDEFRQPVPIGTPGELYVGGEGIARGYWNRPELTAERFGPDPFSTASGSRLYRTGDRVRYRADGTVEFLGRLDDQVKLRGYRIELGEIEAVLAQQPSVHEATVLLRDDVPGDPRLVAYVVVSDSIRDAELRSALKRKLPDYMLPAAFVRLAALPLAPSGKIDRKALPSPEYGESGATAHPPRSAVEDVLARIWCELLHLPQVGIHDNFFDIGGHSLLAMRVVARVRDVFGVELPVRTLFESPTIAELCREVTVLQEDR